MTTESLDLPRFCDSRSIAREAARLRLSAIEQVMAADFGHLGSCMSCAEIVAAAFQIFDFGAEEGRGTDRFILSKGHAVPMLYAASTPPGQYIPYAQAGSRFPAHPNALINPNIAVGTGSVGMGLAVALGLASGLRLQSRPGRIVILTGDGELQAGMMWEALLNLNMRPDLPILLIVDGNGYQGGMATATNATVRGMLAKVAPGDHPVIDGNDPDAVLQVMSSFAQRPRATIVWAETRRGAGVPLFERNPLPMTWRPPPEALDEIRCELALAAGG